MENNKTLHGISYQIEQLQREKQELQRQLVKDKIREVARTIYEENTKDPLTLREIENIIKSFAIDLEDIIEE